MKAKFYVGKSGCQGAGRIAGHLFRKPTTIITEDEGLIKALQNTPVAQKLPLDEEEIKAGETNNEYEQMNINDLRVLCKEHGLSVSGTKNKLISNLIDFDEGENE